MTNEEKELLLKDLCARLPYGLIVRGIFINYNKEKDKILYEECDKELNIQSLTNYESLKPYLRPMSSMTREEKEFLCHTYGIIDIDEDVVDFGEFISKNAIMSTPKLMSLYDWLNAHHFDYHDLIERGLALHATEDMYH